MKILCGVFDNELLIGVFEHECEYVFLGMNVEFNSQVFHIEKLSVTETKQVMADCSPVRVTPINCECNGTCNEAAGNTPTIV